MSTWLWLSGALFVGAILGAAASAWLARRNDSDKATVDRLRGELEDYRHEVTEHFVQTAELVNNLTRSYKAVYDHLEHGAYRLVGEESLRRELDSVDSEPVQLEYIGRRDGAEVLGAAATPQAKAPLNESPAIVPEAAVEPEAAEEEAGNGETPVAGSLGNDQAEDRAGASNSAPADR